MQRAVKFGLVAASTMAMGVAVAEIPSPEPTFLLPGLLQGRLDGKQDDFTSPITSSNIALRRELGPVMGLFTDKGGYLYNNPTWYTSPLDGVKTAWAENATFAYVGRIYLDASKLYVFGARIDDSAFLKIGDDVVISYGRGGGCHIETYAPRYTGWHDAEIRCGNGAGWAGANPYCNVGNLGFCYFTVESGSAEASAYAGHSKDNCDNIDSTLWRSLIDDNTGTLFGTSAATGLLDALKVTFVGKDGLDICATVRADISEPVTIYAWFGSAYGGITSGDWDYTSEIGTTGGTAGEVVSASFPIAQDTRYIRFVAVGTADNTHKWASATLSVADISEVVVAPQVTCSVDPDTLTAFTADVKVDVSYPGFGASTWTAVLTYGAGRCAEVSGTGAEVKTIALENLLGGTTTRATLTVASDTGKTTVLEDVAITTAPEQSLGMQPGLMQGKLAGAINMTDGMDKAKDVRRELGPVMGLYTARSSTSGYTSEIDGSTSYWSNDTTYLYTGFIWLDAAKTYAFGGRNDDSLELFIDGANVLHARNDGTAPNCVKTTYEPAYTGWHALEIRSGNGGGLAGANPYCPIGYKGIVYNAEGKVDHDCQNSHEVEDWWLPLKDANDAKLLGTPGVTTSSDQIAFTALERRADVLRATVDLAMDDPVSVYAWTGATYGGADASSWTSQTGVLATKTTSGAASDVRVNVPLQPGDKFVRLVAVSTRNGSFVWTSPTVPLDGLAVSRPGFTVIVR